ARERAPRVQLEEADAWQVLPLAVVRRLQLADVARFEERGRQLGARFRDAEVVDVPDEIEHAWRMAASVGEIVRHARTQPPRLADVEQTAVGAEKMVHAGRLRNVVQARARHVDDEGATVDRALLQVENLIEAEEAALLHALEEDAEYLAGDPRIGQGTVSPEASDTERRRQGVERAATLLRHEAAREAERAERGRLERPAEQ